MTRSNAREILVHLVFALNFKDDSAESLLRQLCEESYYPSLRSESEIYAERPSEKQMQYIEDCLYGIERERETLDGYIRRYAIGWDLHRISRVARAILQVAMYECLYVSDVPCGAAINEAVELTRKYEDEDVVSFVNGILGSFSREVLSK